MKYIAMLTAVLCVSSCVRAAGPHIFEPTGGENLDPAAFGQWVNGQETPMAQDVAKDGPHSVVWTAKKQPDWRGVTFGPGRATGVRHLRLGFTAPITVGSVLVRGGGSLSVLKPQAAYPGDLADDSQWMAAERLRNGASSSQEVGREDYAIWVLPSDTQTRAIRFSHVPSPGDSEMAGWLGGAWVNALRLGNVAPQALVQSEAREDVSARLVDGAHNDWQTWDNGEQGAALPVSQAHPEIVTLTWPTPVTLSSLCLLWTGFAAVEVDTFVGSANEPMNAAGDASWQWIARRSAMDTLYPMALGPNWIPFEKRVTTRAVRLRIVAGANAAHSHLTDKVKAGRRVWLGELMAISPLEKGRAITTLVLPRPREEPPPIPIKFTLPQAGVVTLVIEDSNHQRVRNLVSETPFPAGENMAWWDGSDDLLRDPQAASHGVYHIPTRFVTPGTYRVRGLWHTPLELHYEFSLYNAGKPAWRTADNTGCWLTTHTPPTSMAVVPGARTLDGEPLVFMGAYVAEGGHGLQWVHEDGTKLGGQHWVGGNWTGAPALAVDLGPGAVVDHLCYVGSLWEGEMRMTAKTRALTDEPIFKTRLGDDPKGTNVHASEVLQGFDGGDKTYVLGGLAAHDGLLVCSLVRQNELWVIDIKQGKISHRIARPNPRGLCFDAQGRLLVLSGSKLVRFAASFINRSMDQAMNAETLIAEGLDDPRHVAVDSEGRFFITDRGDSHQVKVFSAAGRPLSSIGRPGAPTLGPYDPQHLNNPNGLAIDTQGRVWIAECDNTPRRVSVWTAQGDLVQAFYGPTEYGGGGTLDPLDPTCFFYKGMEFRLDWKTGTDSLVRVFHRPEPLLDAHYGPYSPDTPLYPGSQKGRRYFTSCYTHTPTHGDDVAFIWRDNKVQAHLVAALGDAHAWPVLRGAEFRPHWPEGTKPQNERPQPEDMAAFAWTDANHDGHPQPGEVQFVKASCRGVTVMNDLSVVVSRFDKRNLRFLASFDPTGVPRHALTQPQDLGVAGGRSPSSGGNQSLTESGGWTINTNACEPFSPYGLGGKFKGEPRWTYPSAWPGLHASHEAAVPDRPGLVVGHTRLLGPWIQGKAGPMFCINGNMGNMYLLTADGLFVSSLFHDIRVRPNWGAPVAVRNMDVTNVSLHDENFWPSITQTANGQVFLVDGGRTSLVRVDGLDTLTRLPEQSITVTTNDLQRSQEWFRRTEEQRQQQQGSGVLSVSLRQIAPQVDGELNDWPATTDWAFIDRRGIKANFNSNSRPYEVSAAVALTNTHLYAAWRTTEKDLLNNSGETPNAPFKHGGCLDLMLATDPTADPGRKAPGPGDERLLITRVKGKTLALLYRARVPGTQEPVAFRSPWRTITIDVVEDVSDQVTLAADTQGNFEMSVPLSTLHWHPMSGETVRADLGVLRGANGQTTQRVYWTNKATAITADVPSEAELTPRLWGKWRVTADTMDGQDSQ